MRGTIAFRHWRSTQSHKSMQRLEELRAIESHDNRASSVVRTNEGTGYGGYATVLQVGAGITRRLYR